MTARALLIWAGVLCILVNVAVGAPPMVARVTEKGRLLVPIRDLAEWLGAEVKWSAPTRSVAISQPGALIILQVDYPTAWVNGRAQALEVPPRLVAGRVRVPLRFVAEALGAKIDYHGGYMDICRPGCETLRLHIEATVFTGVP